MHGNRDIGSNQPASLTVQMSEDEDMSPEELESLMEEYVLPPAQPGTAY